MRGAVGAFIRRRFVDPFLLHQVPHGQVSRGAGAGLFIALLPIIGQFYVITPVWALLRTTKRLRFNLPVALAMVGLINPLVKVPLFYGYIVTGDHMLDTLGFAREADSNAFQAGIAAMAEASWREWLDQASRLIGLALDRYALPLAIGGVVWAALLGVAMGTGMDRILTRRARRSEKEGRSNVPAPS